MNYSNVNSSEPFPEMFTTNESLKFINFGSPTYSFFITADLILLVLMCYLSYLIILMIRREQKKKCHVLLKQLLISYAAIVPTAFFIMVIYTDIILTYTYPPFEVFGDWFCVALQLFGYFGKLYIGGFSIFIAISKFWFIACSNKARSFGEDRARTIILTLHFMIPVIASILNALSSGNKDQVFWLDVCWGHRQETEHLSGEISQEALEIICCNRQYELGSYFDEKTTKVLETVLRVICGGLKIFHFVFTSNLVELFLYIFLFESLNR